MKYFLVLAFVAVLFMACADDVVIEQQSELAGSYTGEFVIIENYSNQTGQHTIDGQYIIWRFSDQKFWLELDEDKTIDPQICNFSGDYELKTGITFEVKTKPSDVCNQSYITEGDFNLINYRSGDNLDSMVMTQNDTLNDMFFKLVVEPDQQ